METMSAKLPDCGLGNIQGFAESKTLYVFGALLNYYFPNNATAFQR